MDEHDHLQPNLQIVKMMYEKLINGKIDDILFLELELHAQTMVVEMFRSSDYTLSKFKTNEMAIELLKHRSVQDYIRDNNIKQCSNCFYFSRSSYVIGSNQKMLCKNCIKQKKEK